jgi:uncharacterized protein
MVMLAWVRRPPAGTPPVRQLALFSDRESVKVGAHKEGRLRMAKGINYGGLMHKALRQLIADVLAQVAREGLPGKHHFYITFDTAHPGVDMARSLRDRYPEEMTVVMQDWFTDLAVMKDRFSVTLNFGNVPEPIVIPFDAIKTFVDPSVEFGLRFDAHDDGRDEPEGAEEEAEAAEDGPEPPSPGGGRRGEGEVVSLDKFRKH